MKGLLIKEWFLIRSSIFIILLYTIVFVILGIGMDSFPITAILPMIFGLYPCSYMTYDETSKWQRFSLAMPYSRKKIVSSKYITSIISVGVGMIISAIVMLVNLATHDSLNTEQLLYTLLISLVLGLIIPMVILPLNFKFGTTLGRIMMIVFGAIFGASLSILGENVIPSVYKFFSNLNMPLIILIILVGIAVLYALSWFISIKIYEHKDL